uniref:Uncharacterized protein n=1 Tax=Oryza glumipatula TaxID=40148 RepID=A0A0D9Y9R4_9ORYZ
MSLSQRNARTHHVVIDMEEMREEDPGHHNHEPADGIAGNWQSLHIRGTRLLQGWLDRLAIMGEQWLGGVQQDSRLQMVDRGLERMLIGLWRCAQRRYPSHDAELELQRREDTSEVKRCSTSKI